jgi:hybrid cluster-associated redox disulfide protein
VAGSFAVLAGRAALRINCPYRQLASLFQRKETLSRACYDRVAMKAVTITPNLIVAELLNSQPQTIPIFIRHHLYCVGCVMSTFDTLGEVVCNYHLLEQTFFAELRQAVEPDADNQQP